MHHMESEVKAEIRARAESRCQVVLHPETDLERILLAMWMRYDANSSRFEVQRYEDGRIHSLTIVADESV